MSVRRASAFAPGGVGNLGPGFDVLGLAIDGVGDEVSVELTSDAPSVASVTGRGADRIPRDPAKNAASIAAAAWLSSAGIDANPIVTIHKGLPLSGGMGGSAASSVAAAAAAALASGAALDPRSLIAAALVAEAALSGRHLDNIASSVYGGLTLVRSVDPIDVVPLSVAADWWIVLVTPAVEVETRSARSILPASSERSEWIQQMANTAAIVHAFASGDGALLRRAIDDRFAEPRRAPLIPRFNEIKRAALEAGALGASISGAGPTIFAITAADDAKQIAAAMAAALGEIGGTVHVAAIDRKGVRPV